MSEERSEASRKRSYSESSDSSSPENVVDKKKTDTTRNGACNEKGIDSETRFLGSNVPLFRESSINEILKVVSLQSFSNPRLHGLQVREELCGDNCSEGEHDGERGATTPNNDRDSPVHCVNSRPRARRGDKTVAAPEKDERYREKRERNNASAKRSRDARRVRELETQIRAEFLEEENNRYKIENQMLREENSRLLKIVEESKLTS